MDGIKEKIQKLLNKSTVDGNPNEFEREVCLDKALELMIEHQLDLEDFVNPANNEPKKLNLEVVEESLREVKWEKHFTWLIKAVTQLCCTDYYRSNRGRDYKYPVIVGTAENIQITIDLFRYLVKSIDAESRDKYKNLVDRRSFAIGASSTIRDRVGQMTTLKITQDKSETGTQLMCIRGQLMKLNQDYMKTLNLVTRGERSVKMSNTALSEGRAFGNSVVLTKPDPGVKRIAVR